MSRTFQDGDFTTALASGPILFSQPFVGDPGAYVLTQEFMQFRANWTALPFQTQVPDGAGGFITYVTRHPTYTDYYLTSESPLQSMDGGIVKWQRIYCQIPANRSDYESWSARLPGLSYGVDSSGAIAVVLMNPVVAQSLPGSTIATATTITNHGYVLGDIVALTYETSVFGVKRGEYSFAIQVTSVPTPKTFTFVSNIDLSTFKFLWAQKAGHARPPITRVVDSRLDYAYFLAGATIIPKTPPDTIPHAFTLPDEIPIIEVVDIYDRFQSLTETYSTLTAPTQNSYQALITDGSWVVAEPSSKRRWKGNIYERVTRYIRAQ